MTKVASCCNNSVTCHVMNAVTVTVNTMSYGKKMQIILAKSGNIQIFMAVTCTNSIGTIIKKVPVRQINSY